MHLLHFSSDFAATARETVSAWKVAGFDPASAPRDLEKLCAKSAEEFHPDGTALVEEIFDGKFEGGQASNFVSNQVSGAEVSTATPISGTVAETPTSTDIGVDAKAVSTTPLIIHEPTQEDIATQATSTPTPTAPEVEVATEHPTDTPDESE